MIVRDQLWKAFIEEHFEDLVLFFFPKLHLKIDFKVPPEFLDKELAKIAPVSSKGLRFVDKLIKVKLKNGQEKWLLVHVEVQGYADDEFSKRMFVYYYRIRDKYDQEVLALAILTDDNPNFHPTSYRSGFHGTGVLYRFNAFKVLKNPPESFKDKPGVFPIVMELAWHALKANKLNDENLLELKWRLALRLFRTGLPRKKVESVLNFIGHYVSFAKPQTQAIFERRIDEVTKSTHNMTVLEMAKQLLQEEAREEAIEIGLREGRQVGLTEGRQVGLTEGRQVGRQEGIEIGVAKSAEKMLLNSMKPSMVSNILDLPLKRVLDIRDGLVVRLLEENISANEISETLELTLEEIREIHKNADKKAKPETPGQN